MEVAGVFYNPSPSTAAAAISHAGNSRRRVSVLTVKQKQPRSCLSVVGSDRCFSDNAHLQYYDNAVNNEKVKKKEVKKKLKLLKGLSKNLSTLSDMGFDLKSPDNGLDHQVRGQMITEAAELLVRQLQKLKEEELENKRKKKEEKAKKKAIKAAAAAQMMESSSSSSESECEKVVNMSSLKPITAIPPPIDALNQETIPIAVPVEAERSEKRIEVCMGGKCKKAGAAQLLENFTAAVGSAGGGGAVVGCKCMGKCRDGPNVRVRCSDESTASGPLCIGVGLEDVDSIVSNFFNASSYSSSVMEPALC